MRKGRPHPTASETPSVDASAPRRPRSQTSRLLRSSRRGKGHLQSAHNDDLTLSDFTNLLGFSSAGICLLSFAIPVPCDINEWSFVDALYTTPSKCLQANLSFARTRSKTAPEELIGRDLKALFPESLGFRDMFQAWHNHHLSRDGFEFQLTTTNDKSSTLHVACYGQIVGNGLHRMWIITREIAKRTPTNRSATTGEHHLRALLDQPGVLFVRAYPDGAISFYTEETRRGLGIDRRTGPTVETVLGPRCHPSDRQAFESLTFQRHLRTAKPTRVTVRLITETRGIRAYSIQQIPFLVGDEIAWFDIIAVEPPVVVGKPATFLASGFAHDANNHLLIASANVESAARMLGETHGALKPLHAALSAITQTSAIYTQGRKLEYGITPNPTIVDVGQEFAQSIAQCQPLLSDTVTLSTPVKPGEIFVRIDPTHFRQILTNLIINANEALRERGTITLSATRKGRDPEQRCPIRGHEVVCVSVSDNGPGIELPVLETIFTPFFTTKSSSTPRGLGLAMVKTLIERNDGEISATSAQGIGTTFTLCLPSGAAQPLNSERGAQNQPPPFRALSILIADDEESVREIFEGALTARGHRATIRSDAGSLLATLEEEHAAFDAIIIDDGMPNSSGPELVSAIREIHPEIPILVVSGDPSAASRMEVRDQRTSFLGKPFTFEKLYSKIETASGEPSRSGEAIVPLQKKRAAVPTE